jgi:translocation and assembly module TamA
VKAQVFARWPGTGLLATATALAGLAAWATTASAQAQPDTPAPASQAPLSPLPAPAADAPVQADWILQVQAPGPLKALLEQNLDLARLRTLAPDAKIGAVEWQRLVDAAPAQARELLQTEGYFNAQVQIQLREAGAAEGTTPPSVVVSVQPGQRASIGRFDLLFEGDMARALADADLSAQAVQAELRERWPLPVGSVFRQADWSDAKNGLLARLRASGYAAASLSGTAARVDADTDRVRLYVVADSGPLFRSGPIIVEGLTRQEAQTVRNLAGFGAGTVVTEARLLDFQDRLQKSGLFERASVSLNPDPSQAAAAEIRVAIHELARHQLTAGVGVSTSAGLRLTLEHLDRRAFGRALSARNKLEWGQERQAWEGELSTHVREDGYRWFVGPTVERLKTDEDVVLAQRVRAGRAQEFSRMERNQYVEWDRSVRRTPLTRTEDQALTGNQRWVWRDLDDPILPTEGLAATLRLGAGYQKGDGGDSPLALAHGRLTAYQPLGQHWYGQARLEVGQVLLRQSVNVADHLGFRAGGDDSVRGYAARSLGPVKEGAVAAGKVMVTASAELARPFTLALPSLWGAAFIDAGQAADSWSTLSPVLGYGVGLRWRSPVGPLKLDLAYGRAERRVRLHFSVGIVF